MEIITADFSKFGYVDIKLAAQLLKTYVDKGADFLGRGITVNLNTSSGCVFLSDEDYNVGVLDEEHGVIVQFFTCLECGYENTQFDAEFDGKDFMRFNGFCSNECWEKNR